MASKTISSKVNVSRCSQCPGNTEYHCRTCGQNLCPPCKWTHTISLDTKDHNVTIYREKFNFLYKREMCITHPDQVYEKYCETCEFPVCFSCEENRQHQLQNIRSVYEDKLKQNKEDLINMRSYTLYYVNRLKFDLNRDITTCQKEMFPHKAKQMLHKAQILKYSMDTILSNGIYLKHSHRCLVQIKRLKEHITKIRRYEELYEQSANRPVRFLRFLKKVCTPSMQDTPYLTQHCLLSMTQEINLEDLIKFLSKIQIAKRGKQRRTRNKLLLTLMPSPVLQKTISMTDVNQCRHISYVTPDRVWVSDFGNLNLIDTTTGDKIHTVKDICYVFHGIHTVNTAGEMIYINKKMNIMKLSNDMELTTTFLATDSLSIPLCVYCSLSTGDILIGMHNPKIPTGKVTRYNSNGRITQTIQHGDLLYPLYRTPIYITENNNGDVVVSDERHHNFIGAVVVTSHRGNFRFFYNGHPSLKSSFLFGINPLGICTDVFSNILVCDTYTKTVQIIDRNGQFLSYLLVYQAIGKNTPSCLSYDKYTHRLWVGAFEGTNKVSVYRYIERHNSKFDYLLMYGCK